MRRRAAFVILALMAWTLGSALGAIAPGSSGVHSYVLSARSVGGGSVIHVRSPKAMLGGYGVASRLSTSL